MTWKFLSILAVIACVLYFFFNGKYLNNARKLEVSEDVLKFRRARFETYQSNEKSRIGPGENGVGLHLHGEEKEKGDSLMDKEAFNIIASDKISLERSVKDVRDSR